MNHLERAAQQREQALNDFYSWCAVFGFQPVKDMDESDKIQFKDQATQEVWLKLMRQTLDNFGLEAQGDELKTFTWQDDGKQDLTLRVTHGEAEVTVKLSKDNSEELS